ncbi:MAG: tetratricopeptide repeat protein [Kiritimatiellae bacterium]|nr:tetratricopeptide repeat protein [Kiritimatiellia bacterium]
MKMQYWIGCAMLVMGAVTAAGGELPSVALDSAIYAEETLGDLNKAIGIYETIVADAQAQRPNVAQACYRLGLCYLKKGDHAKAIEKLTETVERYPDQKAVAERAGAQLARLKPAARPPNTARARQIGEEDRRESEKSAARGWQLWQARKLQDAEKAFAQAVEKNPANANAWNGLGWARQNQGMPSNAQAAFEECLAIQPDHAAALNGLGWIAKGAGKPRDAIRHWEAAVRAAPTATAALSGLVATYAELKEYNLVVKYARMWLAVEPGNSDAKAALKNAETNGGAYAETENAQPVASKPLKLEPAPWPDGEMTRYSMKTGAGMEIGDHRWSVVSCTNYGTAMWRVEQYLSVTFNTTFQYSRVDADKDSFAPVSGLTRNSMGEFSADYGPDRIKLTSKAGGTSASRDIPMDRVAYDNEQALFLIRRLPLAEGYSAAFEIFPVQGGAPVRCTIAVSGKEKVTVPAGTFDSYKLDLAVFSGAIKALQHTLWISSDKRRLLVKHDAGQAVEELVEVARTKVGQKVVFEDQELGISMTGPAGWQFVKNPSTGNYKLEIALLPPEMSAWAAFTVAANTGTPSAKTVAEKDIEVLRGFFKEYAVRPDSWREAAIGGVPAATFAADYDDNGAKKVEYRAYLVDKSCVYWFVFRTGKDEFEKQKPEFDSLVKSFTIMRK